jgi:hypothetical protein
MNSLRVPTLPDRTPNRHASAPTQADYRTLASIEHVFYLGIMDDLQPIGPTRHYVIVCHDGRTIDVDAVDVAGRVLP